MERSVSFLNDEIDFRVSFDDSDDEDYTVFFDKNSFSYKKICTNDLKKDSENDNEKVIPSLPSPEPTISCFDDLDFLKDFDNEFLAIVYNDAQMSKSNLLTEPILSPQHIDEIDLNGETSLFKYDEEEQNTLYFNDLFPFNVIHPDDLKSKKDNDDNEIDILTECLKFHNLCDVLIDFADMSLLPHDQRHQYLRFGEAIIDLDTLGALQFQLGGARRCLSWRQFIIALGLHTGDEMESLDFLSTAPSYTVIRDPILWLCHRLIACSNAGGFRHLRRYLRLFAAGRKSGDHISGGQFVARLAEHFGLLSAEILQGLTVIAPALPIIDMAELIRLQICEQIDDTWAWVALGPKRLPNAAAGAPRVGQDAPIVDEGVQADLAPVQAPQQPPPPPPATARTMPQRMARLEEDVHKIRGALTK
ncbi:hypothetical protein Tco_0010800 [Tanacetum coccineum]